jgi:uncharacterized protein YndB with AHSA1/START domain
MLIACHPANAPSDREMHEKMAFERGWGQCAQQLAARVAKHAESLEMRIV